MNTLLKKRDELSAECADLERQLNALKAAQTNLGEELSDLKRKRNSVQEKLDEAERNAEIIKQRCADSDADIRREEDKLTQMHLKLARLQKELSKVSLFAFGRKKELKNQISALNTDISSQTAIVSQSKYKSSLYDISGAMAAEKKERSMLDVLVEKFHLAEVEFESNSTKIAELTLCITEREAEKTKVMQQIDSLSRETKEREKVEEQPKAEQTHTVPSSRLENNMNYIDDPIFAKLELLYPEHKVFALDSIDSRLRERISAEYKARGFDTVEEMLQDKGFTIISGEDVRKIRSFVIYTPGNEPNVIRPKVESMLSRLEEYYPNRIISQSLQKEHKKLSTAVSGLYQWLGYENAGDMLSAYGYKYLAAEVGRPENNYDSLVEFLVKKYENNPKPQTFGEIVFENPEYKAQLKTLQNKSNELYGMSLKKYFEELGIFAQHKQYKGTLNARTPNASASAARRNNKQDAAKTALKELYATLDEAQYGSFEQACARLDGITVKKNAAGEIYVFNAEKCSDEVIIPYGIDFLARRAFAEFDDLKEVRLPTGLKKIGAYCFKNCRNLCKVYFPDGLQDIEYGAFEGCTSLTEIILPESVSRLGSRAFAGCSSLENVIASNPYISISDDTFDGCRLKAEENNLDDTPAEDFTYEVNRRNQITITGYFGKNTIIRIPKRIEGKLVTTIGKGAFQDNTTLIEVDMSDYIKTMQKDAFRDCRNMEKIHLSEAIDNITTTAFDGCSALKEINIPNAICWLKRGVFKDAPLRTLHIGESLRGIDSKVFYNGYDSGRRIGGRKIKSIDVHPENRWIAAERGCVYTANRDTLLVVFGSPRSLAVPEGVKTIAQNACYGLGSLTDVAFPTSLSTIGDSAFQHTNLRSVHFKSGMRIIDANAFSYCERLSSVVFDEGIETIGKNAFYSTALVSVSLPASVRVLAEGSFPIFSSYSSQKDLSISEDNPVLSTDGKALYQMIDGQKTLVSFFGCESIHWELTTYGGVPSYHQYVVESDTKAIGEHAFKDCQNLDEVCLPDGLASIADYAFEDCTNLVKMTIPDSVKTIGEFAFKGCCLQAIDLGSGVQKISEAAFAVGREWSDEYSALETITISPENENFEVRDGILIDKNSKSLLAVCNGAGTLSVPNDVVRIGNSAFFRTAFEEIFIPASVKSIGKDVFRRSHIKRLVTEHGEDQRRAVLYFPEVQEKFTYEAIAISDQFMDCVRENGNGAIFDFVKYDSLFDAISDIDDKILVATYRLKSDVELIQHYRERYLAFLQNQAKHVVRIVATYNDLESLDTLIKLGVFYGRNIDEVIEFATTVGNTAVLAQLMNLKNSEINNTEMDWEL